VAVTYPTGSVETADRLERVKMAAEASREMVFIDVFIVIIYSSTNGLQAQKKN